MVGYISQSETKNLATLQYSTLQIETKDRRRREIAVVFVFSILGGSIPPVWLGLTAVVLSAKL
jgi:hypothetical protein